MPITADDRMRVYSAQTTVELRQKSVMYNLLDKSWEDEWAAGAAVVPIPSINWDESNGSVVPSARSNNNMPAANPNWADTATLDQNLKNFQRSGGYGATNEIDWNMALELPWDVIGRVRSRQNWVLKNQIDRGIYSAIAGTPSQTITAGTAGQTFVARATPYDYKIATGKRHPVATAIELFALEMADANVIDGDESPTGDAGVPFVILQPALGMSLAQWLESQGHDFDPLTAAMFSQNPAALTSMNPLHMYRGCMIITWSALAKPTGTENWSFYGGTMAAGACGVREPIVQYFPPELNQVSEKPAHLLRQIGDYAVVELEDDLHRKLVVLAD